VKLRVSKARLRRDGLTGELSGLLVLHHAGAPDVFLRCIHPLQWYVDDLRELDLRDAQWAQEFLEEDLTRVCRWSMCREANHGCVAAS